ncbi:hypothetical protein conserved [Leishmania donovani]|uniref:Uncharacterized protein n=3 Tax=Leishmania donovani species complex TaxID=38574 RepID=A4IE08_LEIIN|nr:conserved hypothetical protein [Leishmania infantum JPCM5]CAC9552845.1 hypothetical_protein_-_conserved [Leishmania infantum]CAJ1993996.1 hypothetical protein conserved [Leishmania donovani]CAM73096.1 conserved hypothetical protein [Leishmania infantum JPCM5]SUZ47002.1 hypothetical_protein_-_conserved [Leishmania infantum]VDZ49816.1 hypothetical_protein_conserved [Leishmania donovani]|eukprot:XP_001469977.1 conserved hypothetical protein [Leishmania infantum JPCM5]
MTEPACSNPVRAALRFYAAQGTEGTADSAADPTHQLAVAHSAPSPSADAMQAALEAFINSREEDAVSFVAGFLHLTPSDRVTALAKLEAREEVSPAGDAAAGNELSETRMPAATCAEQLRRLQQHELQAKQLALVERLSGEAQKANHDYHSVKTRTHSFASGQRPLDDDTSAAPAGVKSSPTRNGDAEGLETIELDEGTRTGILVAFIDTGVTEVSTHFDNFFDVAATPLAPLVSAQGEARDGVPTPSAPRILPTLDKILGLDTEEVEDPTKPPSGKSCLSQTADASDTGALMNAFEHRPQSRRERDVSSPTSSIESVALPGLEDACVNLDGPREASRDTENVEFVSKLHEVIAERDNCVQPFTLDPLFDYDADILGEAFCTGAAWRSD